MIEIREDVSSALSGLEGGDWEALSDIEGPIFFDKCWRETEQLDCAYRDVTLDPESRKESFKEFISRLFARGQIVRIMLLVDEAINSEQSLWDHNWDNFWQEHETFLHHQITLLIQSKNALKAVRFLNFMADPDRARFIRPFTYRNHLVEMVPTGELASMPEIFQTEIRSLRNFASVFSDEKGFDMGPYNLRNALQKPTAFLLDQVLKQIVDIFIEDKKYDLAHKVTTFMQDPLFCDQQLAKVCEKLNRPETFDKFLEMALFIRHAEIRDQQLCAVGYSLMYAGQHEQALEIARSIESAEIRNSLVTELYQL